MPKLKNYPIFAISRCEVTNPYIEDRCCYEYTRHTIRQSMRDGKRTYHIIDLEISQEAAEELISKHNMQMVVCSPLGIIWDTSPSLKEECRRLGITYTLNRG